MTNPTTIQKLMSEGWTIQVSEAAHEGQPFAAVDESLGIKHMVFHPMDYNYAAYPDWQTAHEVNMTRIYQKIDDRVQIALQKLDVMVATMNAKHDPKMLIFTGPMEVEERDGFYEFRRPAEYNGEDLLIVAGRMSEYGVSALDAAASMSMFKAPEEPVEPAYLERGSYLGDRIRYGQMLEQEQRNLDAMENRSYDELEEHLGRKPNFDELVKGY